MKSLAGVPLVPVRHEPAEPGAVLIRGGTASGEPGSPVNYSNRYRENYNVLVALTLLRVRLYLEAIQRGNLALAMWAYRTIERRHPVLVSLIACCESPIENFEWNIVQKKQLAEDVDEEKVKEQTNYLRDAYAKLDNLREAIGHLAHADFPGFSIIQIQRDDEGAAIHFECLKQYCFARDGLFGDYFWNPDSIETTDPVMTLTEANRIGGDNLPKEDFIIREVERPINEIGLEAFVRRKLIEKNWTAFGELFGLPSGILTLPDGIPPERVAEYEQQAKNIAECGTGAAPFGSVWSPNPLPHDGSTLFKNNIDQLDQDLVLAGTGGKLKMLVETGGSGGEQRGSSKAQDDTFYQIAQARGNKVSETLHRDFDRRVLEEGFPGEPVLVEFSLVTQDDVDAGSLVANVATLKSAGKNVSTEWIAEQTKYVFEEDDKEEVEGDPFAGLLGGDEEETGEPVEGGAEPEPEPEPEPPVENRLLSKLAPLMNRLEKIRNISDPEMKREMAESLLEDFPSIEEAYGADAALLMNGADGSGSWYGPGMPKFNWQKKTTAQRNEYLKKVSAALAKMGGGPKSDAILKKLRSIGAVRGKGGIWQLDSGEGATTRTGEAADSGRQKAALKNVVTQTKLGNIVGKVHEATISKRVGAHNLHDNEAFDLMYGAGSKAEQKNLRDSYMKFSVKAMKPSTKKQISKGRVPMTAAEHKANIAGLDRMDKQKGVPIAFEVKAKHNSAKEQFTIRKKCMARKVEYVQQWKRKAHCLFIDANGMHKPNGDIKPGAKPIYYYREGLGSFTTGTMAVIKKKDLPRLVKTLSAGKKWKG